MPARSVRAVDGRVMTLDEQFVKCSQCRALNAPDATFCNRCGAALRSRSVWRRSRRITPAGTALGLVLLMLLATVSFSFYKVVTSTLQTTEDVNPYAGRSGTTATIIGQTSGETAGTSTSGPTSTLPAILVRPTSVVASSSLEATSTNSYGPTNLVDSDLATAWQEGADGPGIGEWVEFRFSGHVLLSRIEIANGYQKDDERYLGNGRVKSLAIEYSTGTTQLVDLIDSKDIQTVIPTRQPVEWMKFVIVSTFPGEIWEDTALSEVRIYAQPE